MSLTTLQGQPISQLGFATQYPREPGCVQIAFEAGVNYYFCYSPPTKHLLQDLKALLPLHRESICLAIGSELRQLHPLRDYLDQVRRSLQTDVIDVFFAEYLSPQDNSDDVEAMLTELHQWKAAGHIRYVGASTHNRQVALHLIQQRQLDALMLRYNMAHRKIELQVLPVAETIDLPIVAFTNTRWGTLLKGHPQWQGPVPTAADCYRFCLHHPAVQITLMAPKTQAELEENLSVLHASTMTQAEVEYWQTYGDLIYGTGEDAFETQWI